MEICNGFLLSDFSISAFYFGFQLLPLVLFIIVVMMAMSSSASFSMGRVSAEAIPHSSLSNSSHIWVSSASWRLPPSLEINSASDLARDAFQPVK